MNANTNNESHYSLSQKWEIVLRYQKDIKRVVSAVLQRQGRYTLDFRNDVCADVAVQLVEYALDRFDPNKGMLTPFVLNVAGNVCKRICKAHAVSRRDFSQVDDGTMRGDTDWLDDSIVSTSHNPTEGIVSAAWLREGLATLDASDRAMVVGWAEGRTAKEYAPGCHAVGASRRLTAVLANLRVTLGE